MISSAWLTHLECMGEIKEIPNIHNYRKNHFLRYVPFNSKTPWFIPVYFGTINQGRHQNGHIEPRGDGSIDVKGEIVATKECFKIRDFLMIMIFADHKRDQNYCLLGNISVRKMFLSERSFEDMLCIKCRVVATEWMTD